MFNQPSLEEIVGTLFPQGVPDHTGKLPQASFKPESLPKREQDIVNILLDLSEDPRYSETVVKAYHSAFYPELLKSPAAEDFYHRALDFLYQQELTEVRQLRRLKLWRELQEIEKRKREIFPHGMWHAMNVALVTYLLEQGIPPERITRWTKFLVGRYGNIAQITGLKLVGVKPVWYGISPEFGKR